MNFQEFKSSALNPPKRNEETIFCTVGYLIKDNLGRKRSLYPEFELSSQIIGFAHTLSQAEELIAKDLDRLKRSKENHYCFYVKEYPIGVNFGTMSEDYAISNCLYDSKGKLLDRTYCSGLVRDFRTEYGIFRGRTRDNIRFKIGDIVEVRSGNIVNLGIIGSENLSIEDCWQLHNESAVYMVDAGDDQYSVIDETGTHRHIHSLNIMPLRLPLSDLLKRRFNKYIIKQLKTS